MKFFTILCLAFLLAVVAVPPPYGADALTVSPVRVEVEGDPGGIVQGELLLLNEQEETRTFYSSFSNFEASGDTGTPNFIEGTDGLASWIQTSSQVTLKAGEDKKIPYAIKIPASAEPGGHFAAIFWSSSPPKQQGGGQVAVGGRMGVLILLSVTGELKEGGGLLDLKASNGGKLFNSLPIILAYRFSNDGSDRVKPVGEVKIKNIFGFTSAVLDANKSEGNVLPGSIRKFTTPWHSKGQRIADLIKKEEAELMTKISAEGEQNKSFFETAGAQWSNFAFGLYNAELNLTYGPDNKTAKASFLFFVIPWQILSIIVVILGIIGFLALVGLKKYNRWIIKKAQAGKFQ